MNDTRSVLRFEKYVIKCTDDCPEGQISHWDRQDERNPISSVKRGGPTKLSEPVCH